jgi:hypothetical protein
MKLARHDYDVEHNVSTLSTFRVSQSSVIYDAIAGLYSNPIEAAMREVCTNAHEAGRFRVALPTSIDPHLVVQDEGMGMTHEFMMDGYCVVGHSTKRDDDDAVGGWGCGRLAPLAVTGEDDRYTVITQGRVYEVFRQPDGVPVVAFMGSKPTNDMGTTVRIPIRREDFDAYKAAVQKVLKWFPQDNFEVFGCEVTPPKTLLETDFYIQLDEQPPYTEALVGPIAYRMEWRKIGKTLPTCIIPKFSVRDIDLPPSREEVKYSPKTIRSMERMYERIVADLPPRSLRAAVSLSPRDRLKLVENLNTQSGMADIFDAYHKAMGHRAKDAAARKDHKGELHTFKPKWGKYLLAAHEKPEITIGGYTVWETARRGSGIVGKNAHYNEPLTFRSSRDFDRTVFFVNDGVSRARDRINASGLWSYERYIVVDKEPQVPGLNIRKLSEFEPPPLETRRYNMKHYISRAGNSYCDSRDGPLPESGVYVPFDGTLPEGNFSSLMYASWAREIEFFGLHKGAREKVDLSNFQRLDDYLVEKARATNYAEALAAQEFLNSFEHPLLGFLRSKHGPLLKTRYGALRELIKSVPGVDTVITLEKLGLLKPKRARKSFSAVGRELDRLAKKHPAPRLDVSWNYQTEDLIKEIIGQ